LGQTEKGELTRMRGAVVRRLGALGLAVACFLMLAGPAAAVAPVPSWTLNSFAIPSDFSTSDTSSCVAHLNTSPQVACDGYQVTARNAGSVSADGSPVTLADTLPAGLTVRHIALFWLGSGAQAAELEFQDLGEQYCNTATVECRFATAEHGLPPIRPDDRLEMIVYVTVNEPSAPRALTNSASVSGGGAASVAVSAQNTVGEGAPGFGPAGVGVEVTGVNGKADVQAGDHAYELQTRIDLNNKIAPDVEGLGESRPSAVDGVKDVVADLPPGLVGSALGAPRCTFAQLSGPPPSPPPFAGGCPTDTIVGSIETEPVFGTGAFGPVYNMVPEHGVAAELGFVDALHGAHVLYVSVVPTPTGYVLRTTSPDVAQITMTDIRVTLFGDPAGRDGTGNASVPFFTNPSVCTGEPAGAVVHMDSWVHPGGYNPDGTPDFSSPGWVGAQAPIFSGGVSGCNLLQFNPTLSVQPETTAADSPTGLNVDLKVAQFEEPETLATPPVRNASVALSAGLTVNPAAAGGLGACSEAQIGWLGGSLSDFTAGAPSCPEDSRIGSVELETPALPGVLQGSVYLAAQDENPFHTLLAGYIVVDDPATGVVVKIPGQLKLDPGTGQITGVFDENPQFPFSDLRLHFFGGARGKLATPQGCGTFTTASALTPWSAPGSGPDATPSSSFQIETGCQAGFAPSFTAGSTNPQAGGYAPFTLSIARNDGEQDLAGVSVTLPEGSLGKIAGIPLCSDANANAGSCPQASAVGSVTAGAGVGPSPYFVSGKAYLTGPYKGGPYGLVEEVPAVAGPFNLGTVVVRQSLRINSQTAQVTAVSDPLPTILQGIPLRIRRVDVTLDRPGFTFNPTNCTPLQVTGTLTSTQGASANVASRFQVGGCRELPFSPSFKVATGAKASKRGGASLDVKVASGPGQANIAKVAVTLPRQLPSRLSTIQQACTEAAFAANPASCPAGSDIGTAIAHTPVLASPLVGPAYLVSHGGAAFPDLVIVLQGEGITLQLVGSIDIKHGVTSSAFNSVPDAPISTFELSLPQGSHSALTATLPAKAKGSLCGTGLIMPTTITGQNGAQIEQQTKIAVSGCAKPGKAAKHKRKPNKRKRKHK
jgi:hypothetical protein